MNKKKLLKRAERELEWVRQKPMIMTKEVEDRYLAYKIAESKEVCPKCGERYDIIARYIGQYEDWSVMRRCKCGVFLESAEGIKELDPSEWRSGSRSEVTNK